MIIPTPHIPNAKETYTDQRANLSLQSYIAYTTPHRILRPEVGLFNASISCALYMPLCEEPGQ